MKLIVTNQNGVTEYQPDEESISYDDIIECLCYNKPFAFHDQIKQVFTFINPNLCGVITIEEAENGKSLL